VGSGNELILWAFSAATTLAVVAGLLATRIRGEWLASVPLAHASAAALVALFGWEVLIDLPGTIAVYSATVAGIADAPGVADQQVFILTSVAFVVATVFAVVGILRRRSWAAVLGVGLAASKVATSLASVVSLMTFAESFQPGDFGLLLGTTLALNAVPALAAIALLLWPLRRGSTVQAPPVETVDWGSDPSPEAGR
jgi:hypothetical protein